MPTATTRIRFGVARVDAARVDAVVRRATTLYDRYGVQCDPRALAMDLLATHANGCALDFARLLECPDFDFTHDVGGIMRHIDRTTGELRDGFLPRCARPEPRAG